MADFEAAVAPTVENTALAGQWSAQQKKGGYLQQQQQELQAQQVCMLIAACVKRREDNGAVSALWFFITVTIYILPVFRDQDLAPLPMVGRVASASKSLSLCASV